MTKIEKIKQNVIGNKEFYKRVIAILVPIIIQNTVTHVVNLVDNVMVGRVGTLQMSAVAIVNQLLFVFNLCIFGGLSGAGIFTSQFAGANDLKGIRHTFVMKIYIAFVIFTLALIIFLVFPEKLIGMYLSENTSVTDATATLNYGMGYFRIMLLGLLPFVISQIYGSTLRELGKTKIPMIASVIAILVNIVFNYIFIFGNSVISFLPFPSMGVEGAAIATVLSRYVEMSVILFSVHSKKYIYPFIIDIYKYFKIPRNLCKEMLKKGFPLLINEFLWSFGMASLMQCYSVRGIEVVAATNISSTAANLFNVFYFSMGTAIAIMCGQYLGAGETQKAKTTVWRLLFLSVTSCIVIGGILIALSTYIPMIYNTGKSVRYMATKLLRIVAVLMPFNAFCHGCYFAMRSGGKTVITMIFDSGFIWIISFPIAFLIARFTDLPILSFYFIVQSIEILKAILAGILVKKGVWINNIVSDKEVYNDGQVEMV